MIACGLPCQQYSFDEALDHSVDPRLPEEAGKARNAHYVIATLVQITNGFENMINHAVVIYAHDAKFYHIKDSRGEKYKIPKNRCTFLQGYFYRYCQSYNQNEIHKIKEYFPNIDFTAAIANNLKDPKDWLLHDEGFVLTHAYIDIPDLNVPS